MPALDTVKQPTEKIGHKINNKPSAVLSKDTGRKFYTPFPGRYDNPIRALGVFSGTLNP
jgi:hypothetical protein